MTAPRLAEELTPAEVLEVQRISLDLAHKAAHRDANGAAALIGTLDPQEAADVLLCFAALMGTVVAYVAGPDVLCPITSQIQAATERKASS